MDQKILLPATKFQQTKFRPSVVTWNRLEGRPRREDFERSLRAEVRDALWMLCRQWQFGELHGEDAGSALLAKVQVDTTRLNRYAAKAGQAVAYDDTLPLETRVESEPIPKDLRTRIRMGRHWLTLLKQHELQKHNSLYAKEYAFTGSSDFEGRKNSTNESEKLALLKSDTKAHQFFLAVETRIADGARVMDAIESGQHQIFVDNSSMDSTERTQAVAAASEFQAWFRRVYYQPDAITDGTAWAPSYLEYQFACSTSRTETDDEQVVLSAEQYHHGHLDWYSFDIDARSRLEDSADAVIPLSRRKSEDPITFIPNAIQFGGMPNVRWWEFEDRKTDFGKLRTSTTDLALLMLAEFGLTYGNDWSVVPYDLEVGTLSEVRGIVVTDVFGVRTFVRSAAQLPGGSNPDWAMYNLSQQDKSQPVDTGIFLAPTIGKLQEGQPIERVMLARDEMANMVWGIEDIIPGVIGSGIKGYEAATEALQRKARENPTVSQPDRTEIEAAIQYKLGTTVPENWIPFVAVRQPGSNREIRLQRAAMQKSSEPNQKTGVIPRGVVLSHGLDVKPRQPYYLHEEEVAQAGVIVTRSYQRTRWWDGRVYTWLGRRKRVGRGEASSALEFDQIEAKTASNPDLSPE